MPPPGVYPHAAEIIARVTMKLEFATLDVFTSTRFAGNSLAVIFDADGVETATMQAVAREFAHPESVFVLKPEAAGNTARARIFTPVIEMPFAGHPTVGTALALALRRGAGSEIAIEEKIGILKCCVETAGNDSGRARFTIPQLPQPAGVTASRDAIAAALGLAAVDIGFDNHQPSKWAIGPIFTFVPLRSLDAVRRCRVDDARWDAAFEAGGRSFAFVFSRETQDRAHSFHARMFAPAAGVREDPATGSAAAALSGFCASSLKLPDGAHRFLIEQGYEMGRPSLIELSLTMRGGMLESASVGGAAVIVTEGKIDL
jgi:trans-2,3-dihydro-3-hydroxyanthranilate isomerase